MRLLIRNQEINPKKMGVLSEGERGITIFSKDYSHRENEHVLKAKRHVNCRIESVAREAVPDDQVDEKIINQEKVNLEPTMESKNVQEPKSGEDVETLVLSKSDDSVEDIEDQLINQLKKIELDTTTEAQNEKLSKDNATPEVEILDNCEVTKEVCSENSGKKDMYEKVQERNVDSDGSDDSDDQDSSDDESEEENVSINLNIKANDDIKITNDIQKLSITKKDDEEQVLSRAPMKGHDYIPRQEPYPQQNIRSHYHQSGGYMTATVPSSTSAQIEAQSYLINENASFHDLYSPESNILQSPLDDFDTLLDQRHYLSDDVEKQILGDSNFLDSDPFNISNTSTAEFTPNVPTDGLHCTYNEVSNIDETLLFDSIFSPGNITTSPDKDNNNIMISYQNSDQITQQSLMSPPQVVPSMPCSPTNSDSSELSVPSPYINNSYTEPLTYASNLQGIFDDPSTVTTPFNIVNINVNSSQQNEGNSQQFQNVTNFNYPKQVAPSTVTIPYSPAPSDSSLSSSASSSSPPYREYPGFATDTSSPSSTEGSSNCPSPCSLYPGSPEVPISNTVNQFPLSIDLNKLLSEISVPIAKNHPQTYIQKTTTFTTESTGHQVSAEKKTLFLKPTTCPMPVGPGLEPRTAKERMNLDPNKKLLALRALAMLPTEQLSSGDEDLDTKLMIMIAKKLPNGYEYLYALVHRLEKIPAALAARNKQNQSALLLACLYMPDQPLVARFIADALQNVNYDFDEVYEDGNTIIHELCQRGDKYVDVLAELVSMRHTNGQPCFNIHLHNHSGGTPLLVAVKAHGNGINCSRTLEFLIRQGANLTETVR
ncbi:hypothetical protein C0J52_14843 [Blattella germanica]|nr:hypothetical protein C0J52_14843 [Blattella germanica]